MRLSLKAKQVVGVTLIVGLAVTVSSLLHLVAITRFNLEESAIRGELLARTIIEQAGRAAASPDARAAVRADPGVRATLEAAIAYAPNVTYAAIVDEAGLAIAHSTPDLDGQAVPSQALLRELLNDGFFGQLSAIYSDRTFEIRERLLTQAGEEFGAVRIGMSMLLVQREVTEALWPASVTTLGAIAVALVVASGFAQWLLRPIAVLQTGLARLGRGEVDVKLQLPPDDIFGELGQSFETVSATLAAARSQLAGQPASLESVVDRLEDAVAVFGAGGELLFANPAMRGTMGASDGEPVGNRSLSPGHPYYDVLARALGQRRTVGPESVTVGHAEGEPYEHVVTGHALADRGGHFMGVMLTARNVAYRSQLQSTLRYSRKLASLNRLLAGVAHEVKNPLNAMTIHLELLRQKLHGLERAMRPEMPASDTGDLAGVLRHATIIGQEIRRLDEVVQGFLKFSRPEELALRAVRLRPLVDEVFSLVAAEAAAQRVTLRNECPADLPAVQGDPTLLRQALLNLGLNACQAMPNGGMLSVRGRRAPGAYVELEVEDTGVGIAPEHLGRIFNLYFTTREGGSGLGLSMVYRTVQLHDGSIDAESTVGRGTIFRLRLPEAEVVAPQHTRTILIDPRGDT
jgi:signal transduction histidine kinase